MSNPNDDPDVISGLCDDAQKEMATNPGPSHCLERLRCCEDWRGQCGSHPAACRSLGRGTSLSKLSGADAIRLQIGHASAG